MFDFNRAPFFRSFIEVRVERSNNYNRVEYALRGANGPIRWVELHTSNAKLPASAVQGEFVDFLR